MTESGKVKDSADDKLGAGKGGPDAEADSKSDKAKGGADKRSGKGTAAGAAEKKQRRGSRLPLLIALLALLIAIAAGLAATALWYQGEQRLAELSERLDTVERGLESNVQDVILPRLSKLDKRLQSLSQSSEKQASQLSALRGDLSETQLKTAELSELVEGGRRRWKLLEIEDLMLTANERLQLHRDQAGALEALRLANKRLGELNDPRLFKVRERVVDEIAALNALPDPDIEGLALSLSALIEQVPDLPLTSDVPSDYPGSGAEEQQLKLPEEPWRHFMDSLREAMEAMVTIKRTDADHQPLMPPEQEFFLYQNLLLKLQTARLALLDRNSQIYRDSLSSAQQWLITFFDTQDPAVVGAIEELGQMRKVQLQWDRPDISGSLTALRRFLYQQLEPAPPQESAESQEPDSGE